ncbi:serine/threonine protein kinase [Streptosporangium sp. NBC_01810]|uniref:serine/threonine-protein kinase n=1 Tax=Streptosporangium sp. NBC_01810 TaxID=2975951 RepID=UPI002DDC8A37|nr:serine/threonine-protein kinase [Streptosporangium sp. NBC_01810]WSA25192.1 serine/threonine protein kinase [Streptosporangium sp. NBC_01810]
MTALLGGRYRPLGRIASGGMGEVWRARDELLGREVAVKLLRAHVAEDPAFRLRFRSEARIAAGLSDPGIAQVFDYAETDGVAYLVMELVPGESLAGILARDGSLSPKVALDVVHQTARALQAAHRAGVIHRDIKPGNLLVTEAGVIKITDFGIARVLEAAPVTQTGVLLGTAQYVSPEQASGDPLTPATDIYSLGVVAYECLAGRAPFLAETQVAIALMHIGEPPPPLPASIPPAVRDLVMACLSKDPLRRPAGARELSERADVLLDALAATDVTGLGMLTDPSGWRAEPATEWPQEITSAMAAPIAPGPVPGSGSYADAGSGSYADAGSGSYADAGSGSYAGAGRGPGEGAGGGAGAGGTPPGAVPAPHRRRRLRRTTAIVAAVAGCAAAVGLGSLVARELASQPGGSAPEKPVVRSSPATKPPTARPSGSTPAASRPPAPPTRTVRPSATPSATVSTSATPTARPSTPPPPSPSPSPTIPTPTPTTTTVTPSPTPSTTPEPGDTDQPNEET